MLSRLLTSTKRTYIITKAAVIAVDSRFTDVIKLSPSLNTDIAASIISVKEAPRGRLFIISAILGIRTTETGMD